MAGEGKAVDVKDPMEEVLRLHSLSSSRMCKGKHAMPKFKTPSAQYECDGCGKKNLPKVRNEGREKKGREEIRRLKKREEKRVRGGERRRDEKEEVFSVVGGTCLLI